MKLHVLFLFFLHYFILPATSNTSVGIFCAVSKFGDLQYLNFALVWWTF